MPIWSRSSQAPRSWPIARTAPAGAYCNGAAGVHAELRSSSVWSRSSQAPRSWPIARTAPAGAYCDGAAGVLPELSTLAPRSRSVCLESIISGAALMADSSDCTSW